MLSKVDARLVVAFPRRSSHFFRSRQCTSLGDDLVIWLAGKAGGGSQGKRVKKSRGGVREEIRQLQELLGVDDPNRTPQARGY